MHVLRGLRPFVLWVKTPPTIWMEARCGSVVSITPTKRHFQRQGWKVIDNTWWCPACATLMEN